MDAFANGFYTMATKYQTYIYLLGGIAMLGCACLFMFGEEGRTKGKKQFLWIIVGTGVGLGAFSLIKEVCGYFAF